MPRRVEDYRGLTQLSRLRLLRAIQVTPDCTLNELVAETGLHPNTIREHLQVLEEEGLIASATAHRGTRGRPPVVYRPVAAASDSAAAERRIRLSVEHGDLLRRVAPELDHTAELGTDAVHQLDALYEHLEDAGFQPDLDDQSLRVDLVPCPYQTDVDEERQLVCQVHQQLILDLLRQVPGPVEVRTLLPFATPNRCTIHLQLSAQA
ncbi:winged helix-turn-helix transcriptional regulator [Microbacterium sp. P5_E9]